MKTFCPYCSAETKPYVAVRKCENCGSLWEDHGLLGDVDNLRNKIQRMIADNALHCKQYNAGVDDAKSGKVCGPRPEFDTSTYYDGYAATMLPVLRERIAELESENKKLKTRLETAGDDVMEIIAAALSGDCQKYLNYDMDGNRYCKWGVVEKDIRSIFDKGGE